MKRKDYKKMQNRIKEQSSMHLWKFFFTIISIFLFHPSCKLFDLPKIGKGAEILAIAGTLTQTNTGTGSAGCNENPKIATNVARFAGINQAVELKASVDKSDYSFIWTQISGESLTISNSSTANAYFTATEVPQESLQFRITSSKGSCMVTSDVTITILENTTNPTFVNINYTGGGSDGSVDKPYTNLVTAYSLAPGAIYLAEGTYPISAQFNLTSGKSIYGGFNSNFLRKVSEYTTAISDTRNGVSSIYAIDTNGASSSTRVDGLTILGPANGDWADVLTCGSGSPRLSHLNIQNRGVSAVGDTYAVRINGTCTATLENSKIYSAVAATGYCFGVGVFTAGVVLRGNSIYGVAGCGQASYGININSVTGFQLTEYNYIDSVGTGVGAYPSGVLVSSCTNTVIANQDVSGGQGGSQIQIGIYVNFSANTTIQNNTIYSGVSGSANSIGIFITPTSSNSLIERNSIFTKYRSGNMIAQSTVIGISILSDFAHVITNNLILNAQSVADNYGILLDHAGTTNPMIVNNTIMSGTSGTSWSRAIQIRSGAKPIVANNILFSDNPNGNGFSEWDAGSDPIRFENNLIFNAPVGLYYNEGGGYVNTDVGINALGDIAIVGSNITTSPQTGYPLDSIFADPSYGNFRLVSSSPYLSAGKNVYNNSIYGSITVNKAGVARPSSGSWSVGAY